MRAFGRFVCAALAVASLASARLADPSPSVRVRAVHGLRSPLWTPQDRADPDAKVSFTLALHSRTAPQDLDTLVQAVSDVTSPQYGQFLSRSALQEHYAPSAAATDALTAFLSDHKSDVETKTSAAGDYVTLRMRVATAEALFRTALIQYVHQHDATLRVIRPHADGFAVPNELARHVLFIDGLESLPTPMQAQLMMQDGDPFAFKSLHDTTANRDIVATPALLRAQYDVPDDLMNWNATHAKNKVVVSQFLSEYYTEGDLKEFLTKYDPGSKTVRFPKHTGDCLASVPGSVATEATSEASLDVQVVVGLSRSDNIEMLCFQTLRDPTRVFADDNQEPFLAFIQAVNAMDPPPSVVSISYTDDECAVPDGYRDAVNREFMKAALQGISILISAGDSGAQGSHLTEPFCHIETCSQFVAMFPASSPYVTAVGATSFDATTFRSGKYKERVTSAVHGDLITSGGGFSAVFAQPPYQQKAVASYLEYADAHNLTRFFRPQGRAYPDVTALGHGFPVYQNGQVWRTDGTSVSAPIVASLIALVNKQRLDKGQPVLGFLNPLIYQLHDVCPHVFGDITDGDTACGGRGQVCCAAGHTAIEGWDAASGVGTLRVETLARDLDACMAKIRVPELPAINLLQRDTTTVLPIEQVGLVVTMVAAVALFSVLISMRGNVFPGRRFFEFQQNEPARERLLGGLE